MAFYFENRPSVVASALRDERCIDELLRQLCSTGSGCHQALAILQTLVLPDGASSRGLAPLLEGLARLLLSSATTMPLPPCTPSHDLEQAIPRHESNSSPPAVGESGGSGGEAGGREGESRQEASTTSAAAASAALGAAAVSPFSAGSISPYTLTSEAIGTEGCVKVTSVVHQSPPPPSMESFGIRVTGVDVPTQVTD